MKPECSLPCSQKSGTGPYPEPDSHTFHINAQIFQVVFSLNLSNQNLVCISNGSRTEHVPTSLTCSVGIWLHEQNMYLHR